MTWVASTRVPASRKPTNSSAREKWRVLVDGSKGSKMQSAASSYDDGRKRTVKDQQTLFASGSESAKNKNQPIDCGELPIKITLPYPPTVNTYWRHAVIGKAKPRATVFISQRGKDYRKAIEDRIKADRLRIRTEARLAVTIEMYAPDRRKRDVDNINKCLLDSLCHAGIYNDDSQIDDLRTVRRHVEKGGKVVVHISEMND